MKDKTGNMNENQLPAISFQNVSKRFMLHSSAPQTVLETVISTFRRRKAQGQELWAVRDLSFDVMPGESLGIIGRNGAGKSTLLKLVARILRPTSGRIAVRGRVSALLELGAGFHPDLTGRENIYLNGSVLGLTRQDIEASYQDIVDFSELGDFIDMPVKHYSSGMYMRLGFSVAIHVRPDVLLIDEILAVGDQAFQAKCVERIFSMQREGKTIVLVSHHSEVIRSICSHALWVEHGHVQAAGPVREVLSAYAAFYAQGQQKRLKSEGLGFRWGTGEMEMTGVHLRTADGQEMETFATGDVVQVVIDYTVHRPVHQPQFEVSLFRDDGLQLAGGGAYPVGPPAGALTGSGTVIYRMERLPLLPGEYRLTVMVHDGRPEHAYDCHELAYALEVPAGGDERYEGFVRLAASWDWVPHQESSLFNV